MPEAIYNELLATKLIGEFEKRGLAGFYAATKEAALERVLSLIPEGSVVSVGGSQTLRDMGVREALHAGEYEFLDPDAGTTSAERDAIAHGALAADHYLMGCNAIAQSGELVNADGYGNRVAAMIFGPKHVIVVAGMNKVEPTLDAAIARVRGRASQLIMLHFKKDYATFDDVAAAARGAAAQLVVTSRSVTPGRITVVLVGESLGY